jgi:hypothetical protein
MERARFGRAEEGEGVETERRRRMNLEWADVRVWYLSAKGLSNG